MTQFSRFIALEGVDGCGKSSQVKTITSVLNSLGMEYVTTREPGNCLGGGAEAIRDVLLTHQLDPLAELAMMLAARREHITTLLEPKLSAGVWVICDRYSYSTYAYQGAGRGIRSEIIYAMESALGTTGYEPGLVMLFDTDINVAKDRRANRDDSNHFDKMRDYYHIRVRNAYLSMTESDTRRNMVFDANRPLDVVTDDVTARFKEYAVKHG